MWTDVSEERIAPIKAPAIRWVPARKIFYPEDGGDKFLRNYTTLYPWRWKHSLLPLREPQVTLILGCLLVCRYYEKPNYLLFFKSTKEKRDQGVSERVGSM
jgi:hypothetical protein